MIIKLNYKFIAFGCAALLLFGVIWIEYAFPDTPLTRSVNVSANTEQENSVMLPVIMYHHILKDTARRGSYVISPDQLEADLIYIKNNGYESVSASQVEEFLSGEAALPSKPILITFDDGYESVHEYAFPLLKKYEMKAVLSVIGKQVDIYSKATDHHISYSHASWEQLLEMSESGVFEIGNHSYDMHGTKNVPRYGIGKKKEESVEEYKKNLLMDVGGLNEQMQAELSITPNIFAYPFGNIPKDSIEVLNELGFTLLFTCEEKVNILSKGDGLPCKLKRFNRAGQYGTSEFFELLQKGYKQNLK